MPGLICFVRVFEDPGHVPGDDEVEGVVRQRQVLGIHLQERDAFEDPGCGGISARLFQHGLCVIDRHHMVPQHSERNGKKAGSGPDVEDVQRFIADAVFPEDRQPAVETVCHEFGMDEVGVAGCSAAPVLLDLLEQAHGPDCCSFHHDHSPKRHISHMRKYLPILYQSKGPAHKPPGGIETSIFAQKNAFDTI